MLFQRLALPFLGLVLLTAGCAMPGESSAQEPATLEQPSVIPKPVYMERGEGHFRLARGTVIHADITMPSVQGTAEFLKRKLDSATGYDLPLQPWSNRSEAEGSILLSVNADTAAFGGAEGYSLEVSPERIEIEAPSSAGLFYGVQTLLQLMPGQIYRTDYTLVPADTEWRVPAVSVRDHPRFEYRGMHLDVARHFFPVEFVKRYIDLLAMHKMNRFHWHLTEDQGWRIEIEQYPRLTSVGAWRDSTLVGHAGSGIWDGERYGGFYTQEEVREVVEYARERHITVIPEIEMPGHASAALAAYPELGCVEGKDYQVKTTWGVFEDIYCPSEQTFTFLENVLDEVMELFPSEYIHIGGDEAPKAQWEESELAQQVMAREGLETEEELQSYFIRRIEQYLNGNGRQIIGWDEILEGGLAPNATVMSWRGTEGGIAAARQGNKVVMTPVSHSYLDYYQAPRGSEPLAIGGFNTLRNVYSFEPVPEELTEEEAGYVMGAQANVWTEYMHTGEKVEYMAWPRAAAMAEVVWSPAGRRNWTDFWRRLQPHFERFDVLGVNAAEHYRGRLPEFEN
ncbi:MAG: beta-N-acetylhexosaminidase [Balneolaceae bacterium]|nr:beta-N-acetylhexosaminidase [Balneolaceae bacterium]